MELKLKVNVCSLMAESRLIRKEVERLKRTSPQKGADPKCQELIWHRRWHLRNESRAAQLVYAFVRGVPYATVERNADVKNYKFQDMMKRAKSKCYKMDVDFENWQDWLSRSPVKVG